MGWIQTIADQIKEVFESVRSPLQVIPPLLLICEIHQRGGLSAIALTSAIISRLPEAGIQTGVNSDGSANKINQFIRLISEEVVTEIKDNAKVTVVLEASSLVTVGTGANAGGPVTVQSTNVLPTNLYGIIQ